MKSRVRLRRWRRLAWSGWLLFLGSLMLWLFTLWSRPPAQEIVASVDDAAISRKEFHAALRLAQGRDVLEKLIGYRLIEGEAARRNLEPDPRVLPLKEQAIFNLTSDPEVREVLLRDARCQDLLRQMILARYPEKEIESDLVTFSEDLIEYEMASLLVGGEPDLSAVKAALRVQAEFASLATSFDIDPEHRQAGGYVGWLNRAQIQQRWGLPAAEQLRDLEVQKVTAPIPVARGTLFLKLLARKDRPEDLRSKLQDLFLRAEEPAFTFDLLRKARIQSEYFFDPKRLPDGQLLFPQRQRL